MAENITRGTTPTLVVNVAADLTGCELHLSIKSGGVRIEKRETDMGMTVEDGKTVLSVPFTQADTLALSGNASALVQLRVKRPDGKALATDMARIRILEVLEDGEI